MDSKRKIEPSAETVRFADHKHFVIYMIKSTLKIARYCPQGFSNFLGLFQDVSSDYGKPRYTLSLFPPIQKPCRDWNILYSWLQKTSLKNYSIWKEEKWTCRASRTKGEDPKWHQFSRAKSSELLLRLVLRRREKRKLIVLLKSLGYSECSNLLFKDLPLAMGLQNWRWYLNLRKQNKTCVNFMGRSWTSNNPKRYTPQKSNMDTKKLPCLKGPVTFSKAHHFGALHQPLVNSRV